MEILNNQNAKKLFSTLVFSMLIFGLKAQSNSVNSQSITDLDFLIGKWEVSFEWYDTHKPGSDPVFSETGTMMCTYDLDYRGNKKFIFCKTYLDTYEGRLKGRHRETLEVIQWSKFSGKFERTGVYSNWPSTGIETFTFDPYNKSIYLEGELGVQDGMIEKYAENYQFNSEYTEFERVNVANFSDMPITEFNLTMKCTAKKIE